MHSFQRPRVNKVEVVHTGCSSNETNILYNIELEIVLSVLDVNVKLSMEKKKMYLETLYL